ncbi:MAG: bifunctional [glutamine synthetase] adenylyltransferase/[glutamine synthetase]-adenylyl-L-tyrosine phosphorylase, partial [Fimbriimonadaceae bacterium]|nr:bifunctional [glutamine synthetase] adenylyltransferase/[glutamine synthetase]-adenylyl-L-tyrosine phosphorylase [Alphaproteobacteria bacterium]
MEFMGLNPDSKALIDRLGQIPQVADAEAAGHGMDDLIAAADSGQQARLAEFLKNDAVKRLLEATFGGSSFLCDLSVQMPGRLLDTLGENPEERIGTLCAELKQQVAATNEFSEASRLLRIFKGDAALMAALADIGGVWISDEVTHCLTVAADAAVDAAINFLLRAAADSGKIAPANPENPSIGSGLIVLAMGKQGAFELNYSSDIDLVIFYDPQKSSLKDGTEPSTFFVRLTRNLVKLLQERNEHGYVYRVDLRLRPDPGATSVAMSVGAALQYYESMGQNWERAAFIKARPIAGDIAAGEAFLRELTPFIWRRYLDYAAIADVHAMKRQIHAHKGHGKIAVTGHNLKLGRGGIREIEFFVQTQQLIAGGRQLDMRGRQTLDMLARLADAGWITEEAAEDLTGAYRFLRTVEHRLQMIRDEQTHSLPEPEDELARFAVFCGFADLPAFAAALTAQLLTVQKHYSALFEQAPGLSAQTGNLFFTGDDDDPVTLEALSNMGFDMPHDVIRTVRSWHFGRYASIRSVRARELITELTPALLEALAESGDPQKAFMAFDQFLSQLPAGVQLFSLLRANPELMRLIAMILGTAPRMAETLARRPGSLDAMLDPDFFGGLVPRETVAQHLEIVLAQAKGYEDILDLARRFGQEQLFLIGVRMLSGAVAAPQVGPAFADLADALVTQLSQAAEHELARVHGHVEGGAAVVVAMGKLGGREMTSSSDLDLILIYDHPETSDASNGARPLSPGQYYARLTQRLIAALSAPTAEGTIYEVDMRLRPSGNAGPVATALSRFADYHEKEAWTWEYMALTRARVVAGEAKLADQVTQLIRGILCRPRDRDKVLGDVIEMRQRIHQEKGTDNHWDLKRFPGGLVDVEFIVQSLQLIHGAAHPDVLQTNTMTALRALKDAGVLPVEDAETLNAAGRLYHDLTQIARLCVDRDVDVMNASASLKALLAKAGGQPDFAALDAHLLHTQNQVREVFADQMGGEPWS